jgi:hypothetical protein
MSTFQKALDSIKNKETVHVGNENATRHLDTTGPERLYEVMKAEGEVGVTRNALEWINKQDSPFVKAMALTGLAEGLVNRQKPQAKPKEKQSKADPAEKDFEIAEFYRRTRHWHSAHFYYAIICRRYPQSQVYQEARQRMAELEVLLEPLPKASDNAPFRVGQIFIVGNRETPQTTILESIPLWPGQEFNQNDLRLAEEKLAQMKVFKSDSEKRIGPRVEMIDRHEDPGFKDIRITVQEQ